MFLDGLTVIPKSEHILTLVLKYLELLGISEKANLTFSAKTGNVYSSPSFQVYLGLL
jgi:hypothetical protein